jgi:hypothetical protein
MIARNHGVCKTCFFLAVLGLVILFPLLSSADPLDNWHLRTSGIPFELIAVTFRNGTFAAVGVGGTVPVPPAPDNALVKESKQLIEAYGFTEGFFDNHFTLTFFTDALDAPGGPRIEWSFTIGDYHATVADALGFRREGENIVYIHGIAPAQTLKVPVFHDIQAVLSKTEADRLMRACIGDFKDAHAELSLLGPIRGLLYIASPVENAVICPPGTQAGLRCYTKTGIIDLEKGVIIQCDQ